MDQSTSSNEPKYNGDTLTLYQPIKYWGGIEYDTFGHCACLYSQNTKSKCKILSQHFPTIDPGYLESVV